MTEMVDVIKTRERIIDAAITVFSRKGFKGATVREICRLANTGIGSINYHFGDKETLFAAVFEKLFVDAVKLYPPDWQVPADAGAEEKLYGFIRALVYRMNRGLGDYSMLVFREMLDPMPLVKKVHEEVALPLQKYLESILRELLAPECDERTVLFCVACVAGTVFYFSPSMHVQNECTFTDTELDELARTLTDYSLGGIMTQVKNCPRGNLVFWTQSDEK